jgi:hypothetical protein
MTWRLLVVEWWMPLFIHIMALRHILGSIFYGSFCIYQSIILDCCLDFICSNGLGVCKYYWSLLDRNVQVYIACILKAKEDNVEMLI